MNIRTILISPTVNISLKVLIGNETSDQKGMERWIHNFGINWPGLSTDVFAC